MLIQLKVFLLQEISHVQNMMYTHISLDCIFSKDEKNRFMIVNCTVHMAGVCEIEDWSLIIKMELTNFTIQIVPNVGT